MNETEEERWLRRAETLERVRPLGFRPLGNDCYIKDGVTYDLGSANLDHIERIEREGLFVVDRQPRFSVGRTRGGFVIYDNELGRHVEDADSHAHSFYIEEHAKIFAAAMNAACS